MPTVGPTPTDRDARPDRRAQTRHRYRNTQTLTAIMRPDGRLCGHDHVCGVRSNHEQKIIVEVGVSRSAVRAPVQGGTPARARAAHRRHHTVWRLSAPADPAAAGRPASRPPHSPRPRARTRLISVTGSRLVVPPHRRRRRRRRHRSHVTRPSGRPRRYVTTTRGRAAAVNSSRPTRRRRRAADPSASQRPSEARSCRCRACCPSQPSGGSRSES